MFINDLLADEQIAMEELSAGESYVEARLASRREEFSLLDDLDLRRLWSNDQRWEMPQVDNPEQRIFAWSLGSDDDGWERNSISYTFVEETANIV